MKLKLYTAVALLTVATLASCGGNDNQDYTDKSIMPTPEEKAASEKAAAQKAALKAMLPANVPGQNAMPVNMPQQPQTMTVNPQTPVPTVTQPGMNPPHGQPNHRCDIAVGAPLNSKPVPAKTQTVSGQPQVIMTEIPNKVKTLPGMNPPHGEPGHRCDIAVGAPLNSKPANTNVQPTTISTQPAQPAVTMTEVANTQKTAPGMNPPHGQPNHRCDIAVGAPLNSPAQVKAPAGMLAPAKADSGKN